MVIHCVEGLVPINYDAPFIFTSKYGSAPPQLWFSLIQDTLQLQILSTNHTTNMNEGEEDGLTTQERTMAALQDIVNQLYGSYLMIKEVPTPCKLQQKQREKEAKDERTSEESKEDNTHQPPRGEHMANSSASNRTIDGESVLNKIE